MSSTDFRRERRAQLPESSDRVDLPGRRIANVRAEPLSNLHDDVAIHSQTGALRSRHRFHQTGTRGFVTVISPIDPHRDENLDDRPSKRRTTHIVERMHVARKAMEGGDQPFKLSRKAAIEDLSPRHLLFG